MIICAKKMSSMSQMQKTFQTHRQNTSDRQKGALRDREHRRAIQNKTSDAVPQYVNQKGYTLTDIELIPLEVINYKRESIRRGRKSSYRKKLKTMQPRDISNHPPTFHVKTCKRAPLVCLAANRQNGSRLQPVKKLGQRFQVVPFSLDNKLVSV